MGKGWDVQRDHQLFMLVVDHINVNWNDIAKKWAEKYPDDPHKPSGSAISQHISKLRNGKGPSSGLGAVSKSSSGTPRATPIKATPTGKRLASHTPSSSAKRSRVGRMSEDDDSEDEKMLDFTPSTKRETPSRRSAASKVTYAEDSASEELDEVNSAKPSSRTTSAFRILETDGFGDDHSPTRKPRDSVQPQSDDPEDFFSPVKSIARSKKNPGFANEEEHDLSEDAGVDDGTFVPQL